MSAKKLPTDGIPVEQSETYSLVEITEMLGISSVTAKAWLKAGRFTGVKRHGKAWLFAHDFRIYEKNGAGQKIEMYKRLIPAPETPSKPAKARSKSGGANRAN